MQSKQGTTKPNVLETSILKKNIWLKLGITRLLYKNFEHTKIIAGQWVNL